MSPGQCQTLLVIGQPRGTQRYAKRPSSDEAQLRERMIYLASRFGRYRYRRVTALLQNEGWQVNHKRVERLWRLEGLKVPHKQPKRGRLWLNDNSTLLCWLPSSSMSILV